MTSWRWWTGIGAVPLWAALVVFAWAGWNFAGNRAIARELDEIHKGGHPMHPTDAVPEFVNEAENAAIHFQQAISLTVNAPYELPAADFGTWASEPDPELRRRIVAWTERNAVADGLVVRGARLPKARWMIDYTKGFAVEMPALMAARSCVQAVLCRARLDLEAGRRDDAAVRIAAAMRLARSLGDEPITIMVLISNACVQMAGDALAAYLSRGGVVTEGIRAALVQARPDELQERLATSMDVDRATLFTWILNDPKLVQDETVPISGLGVVALPYFKADLAYYSATMRMLVRAGREPAEKRAWLDPAIDAQIEGGGIITRIGVPGVAKALPRAIEGDQRIELLRACVEAIAKGTFPVLEGTRDRLANADWKVRRDGDIVTIWGVGFDLKDDGGTDAKKDLVVKMRVGK